MSNSSLWRSKNAALLVLTLGATAVSPIGISAPAMAGNLNEGVVAPTSSRMDASPYIVQVSPVNNQTTNNGSSSQTLRNNLNTQTADYRVPQGTTINVESRRSEERFSRNAETDI